MHNDTFWDTPKGAYYSLGFVIGVGFSGMEVAAIKNNYKCTMSFWPRFGVWRDVKSGQGDMLSFISAPGTELQGGSCCGSE